MYQQSCVNLEILPKKSYSQSSILQILKKKKKNLRKIILHIELLIIFILSKNQRLIPGHIIYAEFV